jgi:hypothetical protein
MSELSIEGWMVAEADLERGYHPYTQVARVFVFRNPGGWATLTISQDVRHDLDDGTPQSGRAAVSAGQCSTVEDLAAVIDRDYRAGAWLALLDAGHDHDPDLYAAWVPEQMRRDLDRSSIFNRDLSLTPGYSTPGQLAAPGRALPDWQAHALGAMAAHLDEAGWEVFHDQVQLTGAAKPGGFLSEATEIAGALLARRYGYQAAILVRVDDCGEIYARLAEDEDVTGPALRPLTAEDDE